VLPASVPTPVISLDAVGPPPATRNNVDPDLREQPIAARADSIRMQFSRKRAQGLMQLKPRTAPGWMYRTHWIRLLS